MTVAELFANLHRDEVVDELERQRPHQEENRAGHIEAWNEIVGLQPLPTEYACQLSLVRQTTGRSYVDVSGRSTGSDELFAIEFVDWRQWLSMEVVVESELSGFPPETLLAAILYEMTFAGYSNMQATGN
ncbi:hypothetical protein ACVIGB_001079 [Bradyrhizobium sp. USDA 4341]